MFVDIYRVIFGTYILRKISNEINKKQLGLYRDDGLDVLRNMSGSKMDQTRENLIDIFQECGLSIVCKINLTSVDFLDVCFDMKQETYTPYKKTLTSFSIHFVEPLPLVLKEKD